MIRKTRYDGTAWAVILIIFGAIFLIQKVFDVEILSQIWQYWPLLLIIWGIWILKSNYDQKS